jgi:hypothetical protein
MVRINVLEGIRPPLPPPTALEVIQICLMALGFALGVGAIVFGAVQLITL